MNYTRPDTAYVVSRLSRYTHNPNKEHWDALRRLLRYLKGTMNLCLHFNKYLVVLEVFCDANWVADNDEGQEAEWLRNLVGDIPLWGSSVPVSLHGLASCYRDCQELCIQWKKKTYTHQTWCGIDKENYPRDFKSNGTEALGMMKYGDDHIQILRYIAPCVGWS
ncbi:Retrovirus-related Pol polyprotein from transposon RE2 [Sesamum angolense]|uniref:Retrovirus-related Pol polyprotein from transposon RE2 n=1 Tax=Sesamum angolense TaxID=2727404 RepID=A0AAE2BLH7_9LAMI|nr:Retrovirus-related Pol polyprotein from transposon RE2 [Sesamum angolense]